MKLRKQSHCKIRLESQIEFHRLNNELTDLEHNLVKKKKNGSDLPEEREREGSLRL